MLAELCLKWPQSQRPVRAGPSPLSVSEVSRSALRWLSPAWFVLQRGLEDKQADYTAPGEGAGQGGSCWSTVPEQ